MKSSLRVLGALAVVGSIAACASSHSANTPAALPAGAPGAQSSATSVNCDFDDVMAHFAYDGTSTVGTRADPATVGAQYDLTADQLRRFFNGVCGDRIFNHIAGVGDVSGVQGTAAQSAWAFTYYLTHCGGVDLPTPQDAANYWARDGDVSITEAQAEMDKLRGFGCHSQ
jgi:hypothetical protein